MIPICWHAPCTIWPPTALELPGPQAVTVEMAARVLGPAGVVNVPLALWAQWANPMFSRAGTRTTVTAHPQCQNQLAEVAEPG